MANSGTATASAAPKQASAPTRNHLFRPRPCRREGGVDAGPVGGRSATRVARAHRRRHRRGSGRGVERGQPFEVPAAQGEVVGVREVAGPVFGVGVGERPGEEAPALLDRRRVGRRTPDVGVEDSVPGPPPPDHHRDQDRHRGRPRDHGEHPHQQRPAAGRRVEHDGRPVAVDQVGLDLLVGPSLGDQLADRRPARSPPSARWTRPPRGPRSSDSGAPTRWPWPAGRRSGVTRKDAAPDHQRHDQHDPEERPQREAPAAHACPALALAMSWSSSAAVTGATMEATTRPSGAIRKVEGGPRTP